VATDAAVRVGRELGAGQQPRFNAEPMHLASLGVAVWNLGRNWRTTSATSSSGTLRTWPLSEGALFSVAVTRMAPA
jgi:hypothetical protein